MVKMALMTIRYPAVLIQVRLPVANPGRVIRNAMNVKMAFAIPAIQSGQ